MGRLDFPRVMDVIRPSGSSELSCRRYCLGCLCVSCNTVAAAVPSAVTGVGVLLDMKYSKRYFHHLGVNAVGPSHAGEGRPFVNNNRRRDCPLNKFLNKTI